MKRLTSLLLCFCLTAGGCSLLGPKKYTAEFYGAFDTVIKITAYGDSQADFDRLAQSAQAQLTRLSQLYDIYVPYAGVQGLYQVNARAGEGPVPVEPEVIDLLEYCRQCYELTNGRVNVAMGRVLRLWHDLREQAQAAPEQASLPDKAQLTAASLHCSMDDLIVDAAQNTVELRDPEMLLDVGAVAKGYAVQRVTEQLRQEGYTDFVISAGGNVMAAGSPPGRDSWSVGIEDPREPGALAVTVEARDQAVVTSGGYERFYTVEGKTYHHIVDPATLYPAERMLSATVITPDSALADCLSTALFLMEPQEALSFARQLEDVRAILVTLDGQVLDSAENS